MRSKLELKTLTNLFPGAEPVFNWLRVFPDSQSACAHMRDHLLSQPECFSWGLVDSSGHLSGCQNVCMANSKVRWRYAEDMRRSQGASAQELYDAYVAIIAEELEGAMSLGWHATSDGVTVAFGSRGVLMVIEKGCLKTAFLPGKGSARATRKAKTSLESGHPLPRECGAGNTGPSRAKKIKSDSPGAVLRAEGGGLYYQVFRPAVKFIRRCHYSRSGTWRVDGNTNVYGLLKECLPTMKSLSSRGWNELLEKSVPGNHRFVVRDLALQLAETRDPLAISA